MKRMLTILFAAVILTGGLTPPAQAALQGVGPVVLFQPGGFSFPAWYQDFAGLRLDLCALVTEPFCFAEGLPAAGTFPDEAFWWAADALIAPTDTGANGTDGLLVLAMEAAFGGPLGAAVPGDEIAFARIRIRIDVPTPGTYTVSHPYGTATYIVDAVDVAGGGGAPEINETQDIGDFLVTGPLSNFAAALVDGPGVPEVPGDPVPNISATGASIGPFLRPSLTPGGAELPPIPGQVVTQALFIANPFLPTNVTNSPVNQNFFRIVGPGVDVTQNLFNVTGLVSGTQPAQVEKAEYRVKTGKFHAAGTSILVVDALNQPTVITVRLGDALGPVIGTATVAPTGRWSITTKLPLSPGGAPAGGVPRTVTVQSTAGADTTFGLVLH